MAALQGEVRHLRQISKHPDAAAGLNLHLQLLIQHRGDPVQDDPPDVAVRLKPAAALHHGGHRQAHALGRDHQHRRSPGGRRHGIAGGLAGGGNAVVIAHHPLQNGEVHSRRLPGQQVPEHLGPREKAVQVAGFGSNHRGVKHGVNVVRPALKGRRPEAPVHQSLQQAAGDRGLAAAAHHSAEHQSWTCHGDPPKEQTNTGLPPFIM